MGGLRPLTEALPGCRYELPAGTPVLAVEGLGLAFGGLRALDGITFEVQPRELFAVIGPNGAGKSSLFNCISTVYRPDQGTISYLGEPVTKRRPAAMARAGVARMFQNIALFENLTVLDNLMVGRQPHVEYGTLAALAWVGKARHEDMRHRAVVEEIVQFLEIEPYRKLPVGALPIGLKKRVELGRALAMEPKLLLLDEPVAGMNVEETEDMARFISDIRRELQVAMILVEHDMGVVMDLADRVLVLDFGTQVALGPPEEIQRDPRVLEAYLGQGDAELTAGAAV